MSKEEVTKLVKKLSEVLGEEHVLTDRESLIFHSVDFSERLLATASVVVFPGSTEEVAAVAKECSAAGFAIVPRGGGMSYTLGYVPERENSVIVDLRRMNRIVGINTEDLFIIGETGVTWKQIHEGLLDKSYRIPFIGTLSGVIATVGGGLGNNATGVGKGEIGDDLLGVEVVLSDGRIIQTGGRTTGSPVPLLRNYGPDLTGIFINDTGAYGIKTKATFRLLRKPGGVAFGSFGFASRKDLVSTLCESTRLGVASELVAFERYHHEQVASELAPSREEGMAMLGKIIQSSSSRLRGIRDILRSIRPGGVKFLGRHACSFHATVDAFDQRGADRGLAAIKRIARTHGGKTIPPLLPLVMRADPFQPVDRIIQGVQGACSIPSHCIIPLSRAHELMATLEEFYEEHAPMMQQHGLEKTYTYIMVKGMFGVEPIIYWTDTLNPLRLSILSPERREVLQKVPANREAREAAIELRQRMIDRFRDFGGAHYGIGKFYPYRGVFQSEEAWNIMEELKNIFDPHHLMNPGALGLR